MGSGGRVAIAVGVVVAAIMLMAVGLAVLVLGFGVGGFVAGSAPAVQPPAATHTSGAGLSATTTTATAITGGQASTATAGPSPTVTPGTSPAASPVAAASPQPPMGEIAREIKVFFSRRPESDNDFSAVFPVARQVGDAGVARAALLHLIAGPTPQESAAGYFSELGAMLAGPSSCGADRFNIRLEQGLATVRFCTPIRSAGIGQDARVRSSVEATLRQFSTIRRVRLLTEDGHCLFDMSGEDRCLREP